MGPPLHIKLLLGALVVQLLGRLLDVRWHVSHDEFEGTTQQLEAHWLGWLGVLATLAIGGYLLRDPRSPRPRGPATLAVAAAAYVAAAIWHFAEHADGRDPELAHLVLAISQLAMLAGGILATLDARSSSAQSGRPGAAGEAR